MGTKNFKKGSNDNDIFRLIKTSCSFVWLGLLFVFIRGFFFLPELKDLIHEHTRNKKHENTRNEDHEKTQRTSIQDMPKYIAFLRAINVGGHTVKMDQLRKLFEELGFSNVETFIASGNVIFDSAFKSTPTLEKKIESFLHKSLGYPVATFLRTPDELASASRYKPFPKLKADAGHTIYIGFMSGEPEKESQTKLIAAATEIDAFHVHGREIYWLCRAKKFSESTFSGARLEKTLGRATTLRNSTTVRKLVDKYAPA